MDNKIQERVLSSALEFIAREIAPVASSIDEHGLFPHENMKKLGELGFLGLPYPQAYGGESFDFGTFIELVRNISRVCASTAMTVVAHSILAAYPIMTFGSETLKKKYGQSLLSGKTIGAFGLTEPHAGSDIGGIETTAAEQGDGYILNGSKVMITNANVSGICVVAAKTSPKDGPMGISLLLLEKTMAGFRASGKKEKTMGMCGADLGELIFDHVQVPKANLIGRKNFGLKYLHETLTRARLGMAAIALGIAEGARNQCLDYVKQRKQFGRSLSRYQLVKKILADMEVHIRASRLLLGDAVQELADGKNITKAAAEAKLFASETATQATKDAIQIFGGYGYLKDYPLERYYRDAKITEIGDGTSEIQRLIIADELLKQR